MYFCTWSIWEGWLTGPHLDYSMGLCKVKIRYIGHHFWNRNIWSLTPVWSVHLNLSAVLLARMYIIFLSQQISFSQLWYQPTRHYSHIGRGQKINYDSCLPHVRCWSCDSDQPVGPCCYYKLDSRTSLHADNGARLTQMICQTLLRTLHVPDG